MYIVCFDLQFNDDDDDDDDDCRKHICKEFVLII